MWVEMPINPETSDEQRQKTATELLGRLRDKELLTKVCKDLGLAGKWNLSSDNAAADELSNRLFVKIGDTGAPVGRLPAVHIGVTGKKKERELSGQIATRMMEDVWKILGIKPPPAP